MIPALLFGKGGLGFFLSPIISAAPVCVLLAYSWFCYPAAMLRFETVALTTLYSVAIYVATGARGVEVSIRDATDAMIAGTLQLSCDGSTGTIPLLAGTSWFCDFSRGVAASQISLQARVPAGTGTLVCLYTF